MFKTSFIVEGTPIAKGRPKFRRINNFVSVYTPAKTRNYENEVGAIAKAAMRGQEPLETPVVVCVYISMAVPASYSKKRRQDCLNKIERPLKKPDIDNVAKAITDAMNGIVYQDDCQIVSLHITKVYGTDGSVGVYVAEELP